MINFHNRGNRDRPTKEVTESFSVSNWNCYLDKMGTKLLNESADFEVGGVLEVLHVGIGKLSFLDVVLILVLPRMTTGILGCGCSMCPWLCCHVCLSALNTF